jgi:hypothetical protein
LIRVAEKSWRTSSPQRGWGPGGSQEENLGSKTKKLVKRRKVFLIKNFSVYLKELEIFYKIQNQLSYFLGHSTTSFVITINKGICFQPSASAGIAASVFALT